MRIYKIPDYRIEPYWKAERDTPWEAIIGISIIALLGVTMVYMQEIVAWFSRLLEALS